MKCTQMDIQYWIKHRIRLAIGLKLLSILEHIHVLLSSLHDTSCRDVFHTSAAAAHEVEHCVLVHFSSRYNLVLVMQHIPLRCMLGQ